MICKAERYPDRLRTASHLVAATCVCIGALAACSRSGTSIEVANKLPMAGAVDLAASPSGAALAIKLCSVLRSTAPEVTGMPQVGARAQLVMAIGMAFDANAVALDTVSSDIDLIAANGCPEVIQPLLVATKAASLQEAVR